MQGTSAIRPLDARRAGVLLHVTSLPSAYGAGDLGPAAFRFVDFLASAGCTVWQVLPLGPTHQGDRSPYNAVSAMAGNPDLISLERLLDDGLLADADLARVATGELTHAEARRAAAAAWRERLGAEPGTVAEFTSWCDKHAVWLDAFTEFVVLRNFLADGAGPIAWPDWPQPLRDRDPVVVAAALESLPDETLLIRFEQFMFARQWAALHAYAADVGIFIFGDLPIFVSHDSADVWADRELFLLDDTGRPTTVTGVPPDYFAADGQKWNNPHYDWKAMAAEDFGWWRRRIHAQRELLDLVRIDHFRGFEACWHIPADAPTAVDGHWEPSPGYEVLTALTETAGVGTLVAEDLGIITPEVDQLRRTFGLPGMKILQFAFDGSPDNPYLPEHHEPLSVVYTGTHDNDTTLGWWDSLDDRLRGAVTVALSDPGPDPGEAMPWAMIRAAFASPAVLAVVPAQDLLGLGSEHRMNTPGTSTGNWTWQATADVFDAGLAGRLRALVEQYDRLAAPLVE